MRPIRVGRVAEATRDLDDDVRAGELEVDPGDGPVAGTVDHLARRAGQALEPDQPKEATFELRVAAGVERQEPQTADAGTSRATHAVAFHVGAVARWRQW